MDYQLVVQRWRTPYAEVDALLFKKGEVVLLEVKKIPYPGWSWRPVTPNQGLRLERIREAVEVRTGLLTRVHLAVVSQGGSVDVYWDFLCDLI